MKMCSKCNIRAELGKCVLCQKEVCWECANSVEIEAQNMHSVVLYYKDIQIDTDKHLEIKKNMKPILICEHCREKVEEAVKGTEGKEVIRLFFEMLVSHEVIKAL
jgi:hypothetical protein